MSTVRTRFAPSPTGRMHVGNLRTALYAYLIAKHENGSFMLRIEDTDQERFVDGALDIIYRTLAKTGLVHDEGPDKDGGYGPYVQSERNAQGIYLKYAKQLIEQGDAYYCFCTKERLESLKSNVGEDGKEISVYDKHCLHLSKEEVEAKLAAGEPHVIRFNMPTEGTTTFHDDIYGDITVQNDELDDLILIKSDGYPTYNFANVIDDHLMNITHVVRGNEYLSSSPKYNRIYEAFGWEIPTYVHCPLITNEEHKKLSKRSGHSSYEDLLEQGFLTEAIVNYVALLGWCPQDNREIFSLEELVKEFDYHHMSKSPAVFDMTKLKWMNGEYIKAMDFDKFYEMALPYIQSVIKKDLDLKKIAQMVKTRIEVFPDIPDLIDFFEAVPEYDVAMYTHKKMKTNPEISLEVLNKIIPVLEAHEDYTNDALYELLCGFAKENGYIYVDTGAMYRGLAIHFLNLGIDPKDTEKIIEACKDVEVTIGYESGIQQIYVNGENVTAKLRTEEVGNMASMTSAIPEVRGKLLELQRTLAREKDVIMDGRDIGTHVLPDADVKIYLTASVEIRAKRRYKELVEKGVQCDLKEIEKDIEERDYRDMTRKVAPLKKAEDAILVDSSDMTLKEVVNTISRYCHR